MNKDHYLYRAAIFNIKGDEVMLVDLKNPAGSPALEPWLGMVVALADGQHTVAELFQLLASRYPDGKPESFDNTLTSVLERLLETEVVRLSESSVQLPYYLAIPYDAQDREKADKLMLADGHQMH